jgi:hypothetical protein
MWTFCDAESMRLKEMEKKVVALTQHSPKTINTYFNTNIGSTWVLNRCHLRRKIQILPNLKSTLLAHCSSFKLTPPWKNIIAIHLTMRN